MPVTGDDRTCGSEGWNLSTYIALFRAVNVGGNNRLPMQDLVRILVGLGLDRVKTYVQSGNAVFESADKDAAVLSKRISAAVAANRGFTPQLLVLKLSELEKAIAANPYPEAEREPATLHITFLSSAPKHPDLQSLSAVKKQSERFTLKGKWFYLHAPEGIGRSKLAARVEKALGVPGTARNWRTVCKLAEMAR
jgi:uncharacterized protein (DUF1697 family)